MPRGISVRFLEFGTCIYYNNENQSGARPYCVLRYGPESVKCKSRGQRAKGKGLTSIEDVGMVSMSKEEVLRTPSRLTATLHPSQKGQSSCIVMHSVLAQNPPKSGLPWYYSMHHRSAANPPWIPPNGGLSCLSHNPSGIRLQSACL